MKFINSLFTRVRRAFVPIPVGALIVFTVILVGLLGAIFCGHIGLAITIIILVLISVSVVFIECCFRE